jgi:predicted outer membrane repeat protein
VLKRHQIVQAWFTLMLGVPALSISPAARQSMAAPAADAVVQPPCGEAEFDAALATVQSSGGGGTITFQCGESAMIALTSPKVITADVTIDGADQITLTGANATDLFHVGVNATLALAHLEVSQGQANHDGGAIFNSGRLSIDHSSLVSSDASGHKGGALYNEGQVTISDSWFQDNRSLAGWGGAIYSVGIMTITNSSFVYNLALMGGAIVNDKAILDLSDSAFYGNGASGAGGAIVTFGTLRLNRTSFDNNSSLSGGAINSEVSLSISGGLFYSNTASVYSGGAIETDGQAIIAGATFLSNTALAGGGGAIHVGRTLTVTGSDFEASTAGTGGAIDGDPGAQLTIQDSRFISDTASNSEGGAIHNRGQLVVDGSTFIGNSAPFSSGGGLAQDSDNAAWIMNSTFAGNDAFSGGGLFLSGTVTVSNTTFSANSAYGGGGVLAQSGVLTVTNGTFSGNQAPSGNAIVSFNSAVVRLKNTILAGSPSGNCGGMMVSLGHNLDDGDTCSLGAGGDLTSTDPLLGPLADNGGPTATHALLPASPAINHGDNDGCPPTDQRGYVRLGGCDIGAFEYAFRLRAPLIRK